MNNLTALDFMLASSQNIEATNLCEEPALDRSLTAMGLVSTNFIQTVNAVLSLTLTLLCL